MNKQAIKNMDFNTRSFSIQRLENELAYYRHAVRNKLDVCANPRSVIKYFQNRIEALNLNHSDVR
jgi:hypothetical protein